MCHLRQPQEFPQPNSSWVDVFTLILICSTLIFNSEFGTIKHARRKATMHMPDHATCSVEIWCMLENFGIEPKWLPGVQQKAVGQVSFEVRLDDSRSIHHHIDHLRVWTCHPDTEAKSSLDEDPLISPHLSSSHNNANGDISTTATGPPSLGTPPTVCLSSCARKPPDKFLWLFQTSGGGM